MSTELLIILIVVGVFAIIFVAGVMWMYSKSNKKKSKKNEPNTAEQLPVENTADGVTAAEPETAEQTEISENTENELNAESAEGAEDTEAVEETAPVEEEPAILIMMGDFDERMQNYQSVPFTDKLGEQPLPVQGHFGSVYNEFKSYRKMHARVSKKCVTFRFGRELVAKIFIKGKTMRLALALGIDEFPENVYHQKDLSAKKAFEEIPFVIKLKSDRSAKHALALVTALAEKKGMVKNPKYVPVDAVAEVKAAFNAKNKVADADEQPSQETEAE